MQQMQYKDVFDARKKNIIGMVHLLPLPGHEAHTSMTDVIDAAMRDAEALVKGGIKYAIVENDGDRPFGIVDEGYDFRGAHDAMCTVGMKINKAFGNDLTLGSQVLNNYGETPHIVHEIGGKFLRSQFYGELREDGGGRVITPNFQEIQAANKGYGFVILADVNSKGSTSTNPKYDIGDAIADIAMPYVRPQALITTGAQTGSPPTVDEVDYFSDLVLTIDDPKYPLAVGVGSGVTPASIDEGLLDPVNFAIVGSFFKTNGAVDAEKVKTLMDKLN